MPPKKQKLNDYSQVTTIDDLGIGDVQLKIFLKKDSDVAKVKAKLNQPENFAVLREFTILGYDFNVSIKQNKVREDNDDIETFIEALKILSELTKHNPLGLDVNNLTAIFFRAPSVKAFHDGLKMLKDFVNNPENQNNIISLTSAPEQGGIGFNGTNIAAIFFCTHSQIGEGLTRLCSPETIEKLRFLITSQLFEGGGFDNRSLSSILSKSRLNAINAIDVLCSAETVAAFKTLTTERTQGGVGFEILNIASMLSGGGIKAAETITNFVTHLDQVIQNVTTLTTPRTQGGVGFTPANISHIFNRAGTRIVESINQFCSPNIIENLKFLTTPLEEGGVGYTTTSISRVIKHTKLDVKKKGIKAVEAVNLLIANTNHFALDNFLKGDLSQLAASSGQANQAIPQFTAFENLPNLDIPELTTPEIDKERFTSAELAYQELSGLLDTKNADESQPQADITPTDVGRLTTKKSKISKEPSY